MRGHKLKLVADIDLPFVRDYFGSAGSVVLKPGRLIERADLLDADVLLVRSITRVDEALLRGTPVKFVGTVTTGVDHLDTVWLDQAGILWRSAAGYNAQPVAEYVIAAIAAWQLTNQLPPAALRVGVVGVGQVGGRVAERCQQLGHTVFLCDPPRAEQEKDFSSRPWSDFNALDLVTVHTPLTKTGKHPTYHLINSAFLQAAKNKCVLLNTSRGAVVDFSALPEHQKNWTYGFDVWEGEPEINWECLRFAALATPHLAGYSVQCRYRGIEMIHRACRELQLIETAEQPAPALPRQRLSFGGKCVSWREVVLAVFNPLSVTPVMKEGLSPENVILKGAGKCATLFDELRQRYIGDGIQRHEFGYTIVSNLRLAEADRFVLTKLGITIEE